MDICTELHGSDGFYFSINRDSVDNPLVVLEAHKLVVQGMLIRIGAHLKRKRSRRTDELMAKLRSLKCSHKASLMHSTYQEPLKSERSLGPFYIIKRSTNWPGPIVLYDLSNKTGTLLTQGT